MTFAILGLTAVALLLALLLLSLNVRARWPVAVKVSVTVLTFIGLAFGYLSLHHLFGWPAPSDPPSDALLLAAEFREPQKNGNAGAIYLWIKPPGDTAPRAYALPYSQELHQAVVEAMRKKATGADVRLREGGATSFRGEYGRARSLQFQAVEKPVLPAKE
jgi:hypothetical protein